MARARRPLRLPAIPRGVADVGLRSLRRFVGIAFSMQSWLLVMAFVVVIGAVVGAVASELHGDHIQRMTRRKVRERAG